MQKRGIEFGPFEANIYLPAESRSVPNEDNRYPPAEKRSVPKEDNRYPPAEKRSVQSDGTPQFSVSLVRISRSLICTSQNIDGKE